MTAPLADVMSGVASTDLLHVTEGAVGAAVISAIIGLIVLRLLAQRSVGIQIAMVSLVTVVALLLSIGDIAFLMLSVGDRKVMLELMGIAGLAGLAVALVIGRRLTKASRKLLGAVREVGDSGIYTPPPVQLPAELAGLSKGLAEAHDKLGQARAREQALEASRRELVAWVSHDLRTPLAGLRAMAEALEDQVVTDPREVGHYHSQIRRETDRLSAMIDDLFELSKIHAGTLRLSPRLVALEDLIAEVVASADPVARAKGIRLTGSAVRGMPVLIDTAEMGRAIRNLVTNAIRHTPLDGTIEVLGEIQAGMACVSVGDECGGIPPEDLPRVFDIAFRGESARTPDPTGGAGLGLSIARGIVEAHSGQISVRNTGPGCQFRIKLPLARPAAPAVSRLAPTARKVHATP
ncbi:sensor histidine kinase [Trebonia sp.]|uniref:sensor histidine kinase n=1 Tax=Trebonia sp. TaxID=2767075 RepID=UPI003CC51A9B